MGSIFLGGGWSQLDPLKSRAENFNVYQCDVGDPAQLKLLKEYLMAERESLLHAHFASSCGTASRAREKPIPNMPRHKQPKPLRSDNHPDGLPNLAPKDLERVILANMSYDATMDLLVFLVSLGVSCSIENPTNSLFWKYGTVARVLSQLRGHFTSFDACMHGGLRNKATAFWSHDPSDVSKNMFASLELSCQGISISNDVVLFSMVGVGLYMIKL